MSNRRIKDIFAGDLTLDDARRMDTVGNDTANRKFLAEWNPREVPEPDRRDKEALREFLWLKYDGSFKRQKQGPAVPAPVSVQPPSGGYRHDDRYFDNRVQEERGRGGSGPYRREHDLFRDGASQPPDRQRGYWASRYDNSAQRMPPPTQQMRPRDDYYGRPSQPPPFPDRYRNSAPPERFQPPQPPQLAPYGRGIRNMRSRYQEQGLPYEDYASFNSDERDFGVRRNPPLRSRRVEISQDSFGYSDGDLEVDREHRPRAKSPKSKGRSRRSKSTLHEEGNGYYSDEDVADVEGGSSRKDRKKDSKKAKKSSKSKKKSAVDDEDEYAEEEDGFAYDDEEDDRGSDTKKSRKSSRKSGKRPERDRDSVVTVDVDDVNVAGGAPGHMAKQEFDLMSEWMGESKDTGISQGVSTPQNNGVPTGERIPAAMQQAYATQVPMMPPPMSMYGGMMPMPGGGFMPMMPGFVPGMGMPGMPGIPPGMPGGMPPGVAPPIQPSMLGMSGGPGVPGQSPMGPMQGVIGGMQGLNLNHPGPQGASGAQPPPPPPPPVGMPAGPAPGPPLEPPES